jgi:serine/threonine-protein kinase HipA
MIPICERTGHVQIGLRGRLRVIYDGDEASSRSRHIGCAPVGKRALLLPTLAFGSAVPALIVERFDIRESLNDSRMLALEDFCSMLELSTQDKYKGTMERVARAIRPLSTAPEEDLLIVLKRALFAWLIADGDMHLKNMALLKIAEPGEQKFRSVRIAPLYDAVTTRVFPRLKHDHLALKLNGKDDKLRRADFRAFAATAGLKAGDADAAIDQMLGQMKEAIDRITLPEALDYEAEHEKMALQLFDICRSRIESFA